MNDGGPAFPSEQGEDQHGKWNQTYDPGMSLRDWFAGQALPGLIGLDSDADDKGIAHDAYLYADAMLAERAKKEVS